MDGEEIEEDHAIADSFNIHFATIAQKLDNNLPKPLKHFNNYLGNPSANSIYFYATSAHEVQ